MLEKSFRYLFFLVFFIKLLFLWLNVNSMLFLVVGFEVIIINLFIFFVFCKGYIFVTSVGLVLLLIGACEFSVGLSLLVGLVRLIKIKYVKRVSIFSI